MGDKRLFSIGNRKLSEVFRYCDMSGIGDTIISNVYKIEWREAAGMESIELTAVVRRPGLEQLQ